MNAMCGNYTKCPEGLEFNAKTQSAAKGGELMDESV